MFRRGEEQPIFDCCIPRKQGYLYSLAGVVQWVVAFCYFQVDLCYVNCHELVAICSFAKRKEAQD